MRIPWRVEGLEQHDREEEEALLVPTISNLFPKSRRRLPRRTVLYLQGNEIEGGDSLLVRTPTEDRAVALTVHPVLHGEDERGEPEVREDEAEDQEDTPETAHQSGDQSNQDDSKGDYGLVSQVSTRRPRPCKRTWGTLCVLTTTSW